MKPPMILDADIRSPFSIIAATAGLSVPPVAALLAQGDPLSGGAGWAGAGILGLVLAWLLLKHLPDQNARIDRLVKEFAEREDKARADYMGREDKREAVFEATMKTVVEHCERENARVANATRAAGGS
jgi:hypothetical protein